MLDFSTPTHCCFSLIFIDKMCAFRIFMHPLENILLMNKIVIRVSKKLRIFLKNPFSKMLSKCLVDKYTKYFLEKKETKKHEITAII